MLVKAKFKMVVLWGFMELKIKNYLFARCTQLGNDDFDLTGHIPPRKQFPP